MTSIQVSSTEELYLALSTAQGGETIELAEGFYDQVAIWQGLGFDVNFDTPITIRSADSDAPAVIGEMALNGVSNLIFDGIVFDYDAPEGKPYKDRPFEITDSTNIQIINSVFDGDLAEGLDERSDGYGTGIGLSVRGGSDIVIENNEFYSFYKAIGFGGGTGYVAKGNDIHSIRGDGITFTKSQDVLIEDNYIHDFIRNLEAGDHSDFIQFWTINSDSDEAITDVVIRGNRLDIGDGDHTQGIFMGNEAVGVQGAGLELYYQRITIEDNLLINAHLNAIVVGHAIDLTIDNNILLHSDGGSPRDAGHLELPYIRLKEESINVVLTNNTAYVFSDPEARPDWIIEGNTVAQDLLPDGEGYYENASDVLKNTVWDTTWDNGTASRSVVEKDVAAVEADVQDEADAQVVQDEANAQDEADAQVVQDEADAQDEAEAQVVQDEAEAQDEADAQVAVVAVPEIPQDYIADLVELADGGATVGDTDYNAETGSFFFNGNGGAVKLGKLNDFKDTEQSTLSVKFTLEENAELGHLVNNHLRFALAVSDSSIVVRVATEDEGYKRYDIENLDIAAGQEQQVVVNLDRLDDQLQVILNNEIILSDTTTDFAVQEDLHNWGWTIGNLWHDSIDGSVEEFSLADDTVFVTDTEVGAFLF